MRVNLLPPTFSFLLPGLGQVYQRRYGMAVLAFSTFTAIYFWPAGKAAMPVMAIAVATECFLREKKIPSVQSGRTRNSLFAVVGMLGFLSWMLYVSPAFLTVGSLMDTQDQAEKFAARIRSCRKLMGPAVTCAGFPPGANEPILDPWGESFSYRPDSKGFEIRSSGPDKKAGTGDDFVFHYRD